MTMRMTRTKRDDYGDDDKAKTFFHFPVESASIHTCFINLILIVIVVAGGSLSGEKNN